MNLTIIVLAHNGVHVYKIVVNRRTRVKMYKNVSLFDDGEITMVGFTQNVIDVSFNENVKCTHSKVLQVQRLVAYDACENYENVHKKTPLKIPKRIFICRISRILCHGSRRITSIHPLISVTKSEVVLKRV